MKNVYLMMALFMALGIVNASIPATPTTLSVIGAPAGAQLPMRFAPNYTTVTFTATNYTTVIPIYISNSTNTTYNGNVPWQWQGAGTTFSYNGVTYTMVSSTYTQILKVHQNNILGFYVYLNSSLWNSNESAEIKASNASYKTAQLMIAGVKNTTGTQYYGQAVSNGVVLSTGAVNKYVNVTNIYSTTNAVATNINFVTANVIKNPSSVCININLASAPFCKNATTPQPISVITCGGLMCGTHLPYYWLNATFNSTTVGNNQEQFNFTLKDLTNGTTLVPLTTVSTTKFGVKESFKVPTTDSVEISAGGSGDSNYSKQYTDPITFPTGVVSYDTVNVVVASNMIIELPNLPVNALKGNVLVFNEISGGTIPSYAEVFGAEPGNIIWSNVPAGNYNGVMAIGIGSTTTQYMIPGNNIGEYNTINPSWDDGNVVFPFYDAFYGTTISSLWVTTGTVTINNGATLTGNGGSSMYGKTKFGPGNIYEDVITFAALGTEVSRWGFGATSQIAGGLNGDTTGSMWQSYVGAD
ncbi:MAG: hypothetical protein KGH62_01935, partial [Candidatus Micrarchaeota archaeon]|nr:hypothetical protein [Candidatus Micrarchaeota archaeon]